MFVFGDEVADAWQKGICLAIIDGQTEPAVHHLHGPRTGVLAEHDAVRLTHFLRIVALIVVRMLEQAIDVNAGFVREGAGTDDTFLPWDGAPGGAGNLTG